MGESLLFGASGRLKVSAVGLQPWGLRLATAARFMRSKGKGRMRVEGFSADKVCNSWR